MHIDWNQLGTLAIYLTVAITIDGIVKQVAIKQGNTRLVKWCDVIANDLNEVLLVVQAVLQAFKPKTEMKP